MITDNVFQVLYSITFGNCIENFTNFLSLTMYFVVKRVSTLTFKHFPVAFNFFVL